MSQSLTALRSAFELSQRDPKLFAEKFPAKTPVVRPRSARDWTREIDEAILIAAGNLVTELVPDDKRDAVLQLVANQLHHLASPTAGWPTTLLPKPARSEWR